MISESSSEIQLSSVIELSRRRFLKYISYVGAVGGILSPLLIILLRVGNPSYLFNSIVFILGICLILLLRSGKRISSAFYMGITVFCGVGFLFMIFSPDYGITKNPINYVGLFPMFAIFFQGKKYGVFWTSVYTVVLFALLLLIQQDIPLFNNVLFSSLFTIVLVTFTIYFFQDTADKAQELLATRASELAEEIKHRTEIESQLEHTIQQLGTQKQELEKLNTLMVDRELAMIEMKKKLQSFEKNT